MICYIVHEENRLRVQLYCYPLGGKQIYCETFCDPLSFFLFFVVSLILLFGEVKKIYIINIIKLLQDGVQFTSVAFVFIP